VSKLNKLNKLTGGLRVLQILFKEVLQQIPQEEADRLTDAYKRGEPIVFVIAESVHGRDRKTAFMSCLRKEFPPEETN
jgi:hypothetical protein